MSSDPDTLIFLSDPKRFMELVTTDDPGARLDGYKRPDGTLSSDDMVLCEIVRYGIYNDEGMISGLSELYREIVMEMPEERRTQIYRHVFGFIENTSSVSANAFLPFIAEDSAGPIVSTAVIDYVSLAPLTDDDPMSRPKDIIGMIEGGFLENEGAAFGALLNIGDARVCKLLIPLRDSMDSGAVEEIVKCSTGFVHCSTAEFYMDWLEGMEGGINDGVFGSVASGLYQLKKSSRVDQVFTGRRPFPEQSVSLEERKAMRKPVPFDDYLKKVAPRLFALERSEAPLRVMPQVLIEWGLDPVTDPSEAEVFDDRLRPVL